MTETTTIKLSAPQVLAQLWEIADNPPANIGVRAEFAAGGMVPGGCIYATLANTILDGQVVKPVCIVGQWMAHQGINLEPLTEYSMWNNRKYSVLSYELDPSGRALDEDGEPVPDRVRELCDQLSALGLTDDARNVLARVQMRQDRGDTWREAVAQSWCEYLGHPLYRRSAETEAAFGDRR